jgi:uncharacterized protein YozE (UPF0346 family)
MRRQEREMTERSKSNDDQIYVGSKRWDDSSFPEKKDNFLFQSPAQFGHRCEESGSWKFKRF